MKWHLVGFLFFRNHAIVCKLLGFHSRAAEVAVLLAYVAASLDNWFSPFGDYIALKQWDTITQWQDIFQKNRNLMPFLICSWGSCSE